MFESNFKTYLDRIPNSNSNGHATWAPITNKLLWDYGMCADTSRGAAVRLLAEGLNLLLWDYKEHNNDTTVHFEVIMSENLIMAKQEGSLKKFKLTTTISTSNMHLFDPKGVIKKYETPEQILEEFFHVRLEFYEKRKHFTALIICDKEVIQWMTLWNAFKDEFENEKNILGGSLGRSSTRLMLGEKNMFGEKNDQARG
ncbi:unnamed protein product [Camellia sinensis]